MAQVRVKARKESVLAERFAVFAESLLTGVWIAVASLGVVTFPAAFAAGARHLRRRTGRILPARRRSGPRGLFRPAHRAAGGPRPGGRRGRGRRRGGAVPAPLTSSALVPGRRPGRRTPPCHAPD